MVNESFARRYFGRESRRTPLRHGERPDVATTIEIIGVVRDFSTRNLRDLAIEQVYLNFFDRDSGDGTFYVSLNETPMPRSPRSARRSPPSNRPCRSRR